MLGRGYNVENIILHCIKSRKNDIKRPIDMSATVRNFHSRLNPGGPWKWSANVLTGLNECEEEHLSPGRPLCLETAQCALEDLRDVFGTKVYGTVLREEWFSQSGMNLISKIPDMVFNNWDVVYANTQREGKDKHRALLRVNFRDLRSCFFDEGRNMT